MFCLFFFLLVFCVGVASIGLHLVESFPVKLKNVFCGLENVTRASMVIRVCSKRVKFTIWADCPFNKGAGPIISKHGYGFVERTTQ